MLGRLSKTARANANFASYSRSAIFYSSRLILRLTLSMRSFMLLAGVEAYRIMMGSTLTIGRLVNFLIYVRQLHAKPALTIFLQY